MSDRWVIESPLRFPTLRRVWREWRCGRKHPHGPAGFYPPETVETADGWVMWMQECQSCGRFTCWSERRVDA